MIKYDAAIIPRFQFPCLSSPYCYYTTRCTVANQYAPLTGSTTFLNVVTKVDNTNGGTKQPSDFTITVSGNRPSPRTFSGSSSGTSVRLHSGSM